METTTKKIETKKEETKKDDSKKIKEPLFQATTNNLQTFRNSIEAVAALIDEGTMNVSEKGIRVKAMDTSQVALVDLELPKEFFEKYGVEKTSSFGVNFAEMIKILRRGGQTTF